MGNRGDMSFKKNWGRKKDKTKRHCLLKPKFALRCGSEFRGGETENDLHRKKKVYANAILGTTNNESKIERQTDKQASGGGNSARSECA